MHRARSVLFSAIAGCILCGVALLYSYIPSAGTPLRFSSSTNLKSVLVAKEFSWETPPPSKELDWRKCFTGRECARLIVPLNHSDPNGPEAAIALIRIPSIYPEGSSLYRGPVLFNPGGPGGSGVTLIQGSSGDQLSVVIGPWFDVVGFDPRGIARSTPRASFFKTDVERVLWGEGFGLANNSDEGIARTWARARVLGDLAAETDDGYLRHINTEQTARDMLRIVEAHGRSKLQYWGFSYGSVLGATFAAMFPDRVERLVIDGVVDSENYYDTLWSNNLRDTDKTLEHFFAGCSEAGPDGCQFWAPTPDDIRRNLTALYDSVRSQPRPIKTKASYGLLDYGMLRSVVFGALYSPYALFQTIAQGLAELAAGDGHLIFELLSPPPYQCSCDPSRDKLDGQGDGSVAVVCNDGDTVPGDLKTSQEYFEMLTNASSWGEIWASIRLNCVGWPKFPKDRFRGPFEANTSHPILLIGNTADPVTPLWAAKKMSRGFKDSVVLTQNSAGHCSISAPSLCTVKYIREYFVDGTLPEPGTVCEPVGKPFDLPALDLVSGEDVNQRALMAGMTEEEQDIFGAILELSKTPVIRPFLKA